MVAPAQYMIYYNIIIIIIILTIIIIITILTIIIITIIINIISIMIYTKSSNQSHLLITCFTLA